MKNLLELARISDHHRRLRQEVVQYMRNHREDFEPFHDENDPFDHHLELLQEDGTYAGNDVLVAFSRSHNVTIGKTNVKSWFTFLNVLNFSDKLSYLRFNFWKFGANFQGCNVLKF